MASVRQICVSFKVTCFSGNQQFSLKLYYNNNFGNKMSIYLHLFARINSFDRKEAILRERKSGIRCEIDKTERVNSFLTIFAHYFTIYSPRR